MRWGFELKIKILSSSKEEEETQNEEIEFEDNEEYIEEETDSGYHTNITMNRLIQQSHSAERIQLPRPTFAPTPQFTRTQSCFDNLRYYQRPF